MTHDTQAGFSKRRIKRAGGAAVLAGALFVGVLGAAMPASASPSGAPALISQVPFVVYGSPESAGDTETIYGTIHDIPTTSDGSDIVAWVTCDGESVPTRYDVTKTLVVGPVSRVLTMAATVDRIDHEENCTLNAVSTRLGTHVAFLPQDRNPKTDVIALNGEYIVEGITVP